MKDPEFRDAVMIQAVRVILGQFLAGRTEPGQACDIPFRMDADDYRKIADMALEVAEEALDARRARYKDIT